MRRWAVRMVLDGATQTAAAKAVGIGRETLIEELNGTRDQRHKAAIARQIARDSAREIKILNAAKARATRTA
jgi:predicted DNA-binding protein (UPF0251 family)